MIIRGEVLFSHPDVAEVAVIGVPDPHRGEQAAAFVRPRPDHHPTEEQLFEFVRRRLAAHKAPRYWRFVDVFPLNDSGKVQKLALREGRLAEQRGEDRSP